MITNNLIKNSFKDFNYALFTYTQDIHLAIFRFESRSGILWKKESGPGMTS
jgi:hypothetical protein